MCFRWRLQKVPISTLKEAFNMYRVSCKKNEPLRGDQIDIFMELIYRYVISCVKGRAFSGCTFDDFLNECLLKVWDLTARMVLPHDRVERFVEGIKVVIQNRCTDLLRTTASYSNLIERYKWLLIGIGALPPMTPESICCTQEIVDTHLDLLVVGMVERSRFPVVTEMLCRGVAGKMYNKRPESELRPVIKAANLFRFDFMIGYLPMLYRWTFYDLQREVLAMLDKVRPKE